MDRIVSGYIKQDKQLTYKEKSEARFDSCGCSGKATSSIQTAHLCLPFVLRDSRENFFNSSEAAVPDAMSVSLDLPPSALAFLLLVPEIFESSDDCFSLRGLLLRGLIGSHTLLALSLIEVLLVEDTKLSAV